MQVTAIKTQVKRAGRYSIFVDGAYAFSLSDTALLDSKLVVGQELTPAEIKQFKQLSENDKLYAKVLQYIAIRPRSTWELETYLERKKVEAELKTEILGKLSELGLLDDRRFAEAFVHDRLLFKPTSKRMLILELRKRRVPTEIITEVVGDEPSSEQAALQEIITSKRKQTRYQDDLKLMQYLARQGFNYGDIKAALNVESGD